MRFKLLQIFYDQQQKKQLVYQPYWNPRPVTKGTDYHKRYIFMESDVMLRCYESGAHHGHDYFGVLSPNFQNKIDGSKTWGQLKNLGPGWHKPSFEKYFNQRFGAQIIGFCKHKPHSVFQVAEKYHPGIRKVTEGILNKIGYIVNLDDVQMQPIYFNYFLAHKDVYTHFCQTLLDPFVHAAKDYQPMWGNSSYTRPFPLNKVYDVGYWPYHPFIAERLISLYIHKEKLKVATP